MESNFYDRDTKRDDGCNGNANGVVQAKNIGEISEEYAYLCDSINYTNTLIAGLMDELSAILSSKEDEDKSKSNKEPVTHFGRKLRELYEISERNNGVLLYIINNIQL